MAVFVNGRAMATVDAGDRGLHYGDGLFETLVVRNGRVRFLDYHLERLSEGSRRLGMPLPDISVLQDEIPRAWPRDRGVVKVILTRGVGERGYRPPAQPQPTRIVAGFAWPARVATAWTEGVRVRICRTRLGRNPALAGLKHLNRLEQVLARSEWDDEAVQEGLMLDDRDRLIGGTTSNVFIRRASGWVTPALTDCGVAGVMRRVFRGWAAEQGIAVTDRDIAVMELADVSAALLTNSLIGAWPVRELADSVLELDPVVARFNSWLESQ
jgi:4-amino-4-deoxychorismate lyase